MAPWRYAAYWSAAGRHDASGPHAQASAYIRGEAASSKFAEVTFTHETWAHINEQMDTRYADLSVIGWYHSHPDFGIFLSERDRFIQEHFFAGPGQFAYVVDPVRKTEGVFVWKKGKPVLAPITGWASAFKSRHRRAKGRPLRDSRRLGKNYLHRLGRKGRFPLAPWNGSMP